MAGRLEGKVALITGGARGQGASEARLFASEGAQIVVTDVLDEDGTAIAAEVSGSYIHHDVTSEADWAAVVQQAVEQYGGIDVLVNNAGIWAQTPVLGGSLEVYRRVIEVNQVGVFIGMRDVAPAMIERGGGSIVNISSIAGMRGTAGSIAYGASKWAVRGMTKSAARELAPHGVRVNSIHPGLIDTAMLQQLPGIDAGETDSYIDRVPLGRFAAADEVAKLALFLASDDSSYSTGSEFIVDGGVTA